MTDDAKGYETYRWLADVQLLEPVSIDEMNEIDQIARAIAEISQEPAELYTTS